MSILAVLLPVMLGQGPNDPLAVNMRWSRGQKVALILEKRSIDVAGETQVPQSLRRTGVTLEVLRKLDDGWIVAWTYGRTAVEPKTTLSTALAKINEGMRVVFRTDADGQPTKLENAHDVLRTYGTMRKKVGDQLLARGLKKAALDRIFASMDRLMKPESVAEVTLRDPRLYLLMAGRKIPRTGKLPFQRDNLTPLSDKSFPSEGFIRLGKRDVKAKEATLVWKLDVDMNKAKPIVLAGLQKIAKEKGFDPPKPEDLPKIEIEEIGTAVVGLAGGWPRQVRRVMTTSRKRSKTIETTVITRRDG